MMYNGRLKALERKRQHVNVYISPEVVEQIETMVSESLTGLEMPLELNTLTKHSDIVEALEGIVLQK